MGHHEGWQAMPCGEPKVARPFRKRLHQEDVCPNLCNIRPAHLESLICKRANGQSAFVLRTFADDAKEIATGNCQ